MIAFSHLSSKKSNVHYTHSRIHFNLDVAETDRAFRLCFQYTLIEACTTCKGVPTSVLKGSNSDFMQVISRLTAGAFSALVARYNIQFPR